MRLALIGLVTLFAAGAQAQTPQTRIRGTVERLDGQALTVKTQEGATTVALAPNYSVGAVVKAGMADIKKGSFIGVGARPQPGGGLTAVQVFIFPEAMRGTGEGHKPWAVLPDSTMTNATVAETVSRVDGGSVTLTYPGGEQTIAITPEANIIMAAPAQAADLVAGAQVALTASRQADGNLSSSRVTIARPGAQLPL
ncbi:conserved exported hypothetical protein [Bosea sp. 62]|uniref:hypothetical protein n=1 Tax=unclassified Bosea (in: a-proteobacteria) TaxID=2653178 RepID=UPI00125C4336|nr:MULTISPECIES: hypothetical protein [unclassified Bosea (in: a-proteobacteria)]CAD5247353.1 conserved exported hypothetical protein [Bosea sp. 46]CAD5249024.1 conserved exported hypothetical protein [Bosea sp. 21B]CAD5267121.1 conserved exported hypothetical protein [Bosea sp. 7B]VVT45211.1 conserved exported hypothetical protein [Bosea sp. EC-HK365B]VXA98314.1 conserved exported hypothetical protein [Bosea sp. 29B]